jgi:hypothetical protein
MKHVAVLSVRGSRRRREGESERAREGEKRQRGRVEEWEIWTEGGRGMCVGVYTYELVSVCSLSDGHGSVPVLTPS